MDNKINVSNRNVINSMIFSVYRFFLFKKIPTFE